MTEINNEYINTLKNNKESIDTNLDGQIDSSELLEYAFDKLKWLPEKELNNLCGILNNNLILSLNNQQIDWKKLFNNLNNPIWKIN